MELIQNSDCSKFTVPLSRTFSLALHHSLSSRSRSTIAIYTYPHLFWLSYIHTLIYELLLDKPLTPGAIVLHSFPAKFVVISIHPSDGLSIKWNDNRALMSTIELLFISSHKAYDPTRGANFHATKRTPNELVSKPRICNNKKNRTTNSSR